MDQPVRILDTGTRPAASLPDGVDVRHQPALIREPLDVSLSDVALLEDGPCHVLFYSRFAVRCVADRGVELDGDHRLWTVGPRTGALVEKHFEVRPDVPEDHHFRALRRCLLESGDRRPIVAFGLRGTDRDLSPVAQAWDVETETIDVYESRPAPPDRLRRAFEDHEPDWLTTTSSRGVRSVVEALGDDRLARLQADGGLRIAAIGPSTAETLAEFGLNADAVPDNPGREELIEVIVDYQG